MRAWLVCGVLASCGRVGFDSSPRGVDAVDVPFGDGPGQGPGTSSSDAPGGCLGAGPYLELVSLVDFASTVAVTFCAVGITSELTGTLIEADQTTRTMMTVPITETTLILLVGPSACTACVVRLEAGGLIVESPPTDLIGD